MGLWGLVVSDWHAIKHRRAALLGGTYLDMPESLRRRESLRTAVTNGTVPMAASDQSAARMIQLLNRIKTANAAPLCDHDVHQKLAQLIATESLVLLKNDDTLPLPNFNLRLLIIGEGASNPIIQGSGSASTRPSSVDIPLDEIRASLATTSYPPFTATPAEICYQTAHSNAILLFASHHSAAEG